MSLKPSYYNHYTPTTDPARTVLFNKFWGRVATVDEETARALASGHVADLAPGRAVELHRAGFLVPVEVDEKAAAEQRYLERKQSNALLAITVELTQECNLACPFCYQNQAIDRIQHYVQTVVSEGRRPITDIALRFIGGEPLMQKDKTLAAVSGMRRLTDRLGVGLNTQVDTNGLLLDEAIVREMDATSITVTNKADHDTVRLRYAKSWRSG